jgi:hypothetical protein
MIIRNEQMEAMDSSMQETYICELMAYYRTQTPEFVKRFSDAQLKGKIAESIPRARALGLTSGRAIMQYTGLALAAGPQFHELPEVHALMTMPGYTPELKLKRLLQLVQRKVAAAAEKA